MGSIDCCMRILRGEEIPREGAMRTGSSFTLGNASPIPSFLSKLKSSENLILCGDGLFLDSQKNCSML